MQSGLQTTYYNQNFLRPKIELFLSFLGEALPPAINLGLCNGYNFMLFRAKLINEEEKFWARLKNLATADDLKIQQMAVLLRYLRLKFNWYSFYYKNSSNVLEENSPQDARERFVNTITVFAKQDLSPEQLILLDQAEDLYAFIQSLIFAQNPNQCHWYGSTNDSPNIIPKRDPITQKEFLEILKIMGPDGFDSNKSGIHHYALAFNFTQQELESFVNAINFLENDYFFISSLRHSLFLFKSKNEIIIYDPNQDFLFSYSDVKSLTLTILNMLFYDSVIASKHFSMQIDLYTSAIKQNPLEIIQRLLDKRGKDKLLNVTAGDGVSPLMLSIRSGNYDNTKLFLLNDANPNAVSTHGISPSMIAAEFGRTEMISLLSEFNVDFSYLWRLIVTAHCAGNFKTAEQITYYQKQLVFNDLKKWEKDLNLHQFLSKSLPEFHILIQTSNNIIEKLIVKIIFAVASMDVDSLKILLTKHRQARQIAIYFSIMLYKSANVDLINFLCEENAMPHQAIRHRAFALIVAADYKVFSVVGEFLHTKCEIFTSHQLGRVLIRLAESNERNLILFLMGRRPDTDQTWALDETKFTALHLAVVNSDLELIKVYCQPQYVLCLNSDNETPLMLAAKIGAYPIVNYFFENFYKYISREEMKFVVTELLTQKELSSSGRAAQKNTILKALQIQPYILNEHNFLTVSLHNPMFFQKNVPKRNEMMNVENLTLRPKL